MRMLATNTGTARMITIAFHFTLATGVAGVCFAFSGFESEDSVGFVLADGHAETISRTSIRGDELIQLIRFWLNDFFDILGPNCDAKG